MLVRLLGRAAAPGALRHFSAAAASNAGAAVVGADDSSGPAGWTAAAAAAAGVGSTLTARYQALVASGALKHDAAQAHCVQRLDRLNLELQLYTKKVAEYQREHAAYQERRAERRGPLMEREEARLQAEEAAAEQQAASRLGGMRAWLGAALGEAPAAPPKRTRHQRQVLARPVVERRLDQELGPPPSPPAAPKGVYLHGSVGSGKTLVMDLLSSAVHAEHTVPLHRRLHFNSAMLELHSRMHAIESHRMAQEQQQMDTYAAAVAEQQRQEQQRRDAKRAGGAAGVAEQEQEEGEGGGSAWKQILKMDPIAQKLRRSKLARLAFRRMVRDMQSRTVSEHSEALAASNAAIVRHAARALIQGCDTLELMHATRRGSHGSGHDQAHRISALLCFDEMQISDVFSAIALKGLFEALTAEGCVVVATSNRAPSELDRHGLHEDLFGHFMKSLAEACDVVSLDSEEDYRRLLAAQAPLHPLPDTPTGPNGSATGNADGTAVALPEAPHPSASYFYPLGPAAAAALEAQWARVAGGQGSEAAPQGGAGIQVMFGRTLQVGRAVGGAAWCTFSELCARPLGAADYLALAQTFHTVFLEGVPAMDMQVRDQARRFITLVDELYNHRVRLVCSAADAPDALFAGADHSEPIIDLESLQFETAVEGSRLRTDLMADGGVAPVAATAEQAASATRTLGGGEEQFAFRRAVSRLHEMQSELYLATRPRQ